MVSKIMLRFSAGPASQRNVLHQSHRIGSQLGSWMKLVHTGSNPADASRALEGSQRLDARRLCGSARSGVPERLLQFFRELLGSPWLHFGAHGKQDHASYFRWSIFTA